MNGSLLSFLLHPPLSSLYVSFSPTTVTSQARVVLPPAYSGSDIDGPSTSLVPLLDQLDGWPDYASNIPPCRRLHNSVRRATADRRSPRYALRLTALFKSMAQTREREGEWGGGLMSVRMRHGRWYANVQAYTYDACVHRCGGAWRARVCEVWVLK